MRDYAKITPQFWIGETGKAIKQLGCEAQLVALYLITNPHTNMLGIYYLPQIFIAHETGIPFEGASKALQSLCEIGFCTYDKPSEHVWVHEMAFYQIGEQIKATDNRVKSINDAYEDLPNLPFLKYFYDKYKDALVLSNPRANASPFGGPSKPLRSQEQEQEQEQDQEQKQEQEQEHEQENDLVAENGSSVSVTAAVDIIFDHWKKIMHYPDAKLDDKRKDLIQKALNFGYSIKDLCEAITGCSHTPHNMGNNDRGQRFDGLHVILRDADQIDRFIRNAHSPPKPLTPLERSTQANVNVLQSWLDKKMNEGNKTHGKK